MEYGQLGLWLVKACIPLEGQATPHGTGEQKNAITTLNVNGVFYISYFSTEQFSPLQTYSQEAEQAYSVKIYALKHMDTSNSIRFLGAGAVAQSLIFMPLSYLSRHFVQCVNEWL